MEYLELLLFSATQTVQAPNTADAFHGCYTYLSEKVFILVYESGLE